MTNGISAAQQFRISPSMGIGYVSLNVSDIQRSLDFYESVLGFKSLGKPSEGRAVLSADGSRPLVELLRAKDAENGTRRAGLYHFAILLPERKYLADMLQSLREKSGQVHFDGLADHLVSEAIYIRDPDFNGVEVYRDRPLSEWKWKDDMVGMATLRLDTEGLLKEATASGWKSMPAKTVIGHVHLHVRNLAKAMKFYHDVLGLDFTATYPSAYFFSAGGYHHHVAANTWLGTISRASPDNLGLNHFGIELPDSEALERTYKHVSGHEAHGSEAYVLDPNGIRIKLYSR
jgi:catechol 2,3-dioxygenase